jgi:hypothetical protein
MPALDDIIVGVFHFRSEHEELRIDLRQLHFEAGDDLQIPVLGEVATLNRKMSLQALPFG